LKRELLIAGLLLLVCATVGWCAEAPADPFLKTDGLQIRSAQGHGPVILLRGTSLGGWLLREAWMCPMDSSGTKDDRAARDLLEERFGAVTAESLLATYQDHWITATDFDNIAALGLNVVRLPFWYRNFQSESGQWKQEPFARLDWAVREAWKRHIYTVLDLHGAPGGQSESHTCGAARAAAELWTNPAYQERTIEIWQRLAEHFKGNPAIAMYDLLNEPYKAPSQAALWDLHERLYQAIRKVDPDHIITVEGCWNGVVNGRRIGWSWEDLPRPAEQHWTNVVYQLHSYEFGHPNDTAAQIRNTDGQVAAFGRHKDWNVPCFIGEFNVMNPQPDPLAIWIDTLRKFNAAGMHWAAWAYKDGKGRHDNSWGIYNPNTPLKVPNLKQDSAEVIREAWSKLDTPAYFVINPLLQKAFAAAPQ